MADESGDGTGAGSGTGDPSSTAAATAATAPTVRVAGVIGVVAPFNDKEEEWIDYAERLEHYFIANDITDVAKKRAILLNAVGASTYRLIKTLALPGVPKDLTFEQIVEKVTAHYNPKPSVIIKRFEFNTRVQKEGESVAEFVAALQKITEHCEFGTFLDDLLRDRLVCGVLDKKVQHRFLQESKLTYKQAFDMAIAAEAARKDAKRLQEHREETRSGETRPPETEEKPTPVNRVTKNAPRTDGRGKTECHRCGGKHPAARCKFKDYECHFCKKKGHLAAVCRKKKRVAARSEPKREQAHHITDNSDDDNDDEYNLYRVSSGSTKPLLVTVKLNSVDTEMEVDTGASVSIMSEEKFQQFRGSTSVTLQPSKAKLFTYTGEAIGVLGSTEVTVEHNQQVATLPLIVTKGTGPCLLGRNWLAKLRLDWQQIFSVRTGRTLQTVLDKYPDVFKDDLGTVKGLKAKIHVDPKATPLYHKARSVPLALREKIETELDRLQAQGIIEPVQFSEWAAPIVPVIKSDGSVRICGDYKVTVNRVAKLDKYPLPLIDDLFASLAGGKRFTTLDLSHAYQQIELDDESRQYVTISTHKGLFRYNRLPFGVASAPSIFQRTMENLLQGIQGVCVYIDDILISGRTDEEHLEHLDEVIRRLAEAGMRLKKKKCAYLLSAVDYLGHVINAEGLRTSDSKIAGIVKAPAPRDVSELRSFLGLVNYYGKFLPDLANTLSPLYALLQKKKKWSWGANEEEAFQAVKKLLQSSRVLVHFDPSLPLILSCDASPYGLGAVLSHKMPNGEERPVGFASRTLTATELKYSQLDKEALAIVFGVKKYHSYLYGRQFVLKTDHKPLTHIFKETRAIPTLASGRIQRWALILSAYSYTIQYKPGKENSNADALSRLPAPGSKKEPPRPPEVVHLMEYLDSSPVSSAQIRTWTDQDPLLSKVKRWILSGWPDPTPSEEEELKPFSRRRYELSVEDGCVLWGSRVIVPQKGRPRVLKMLHEAHPGISRMKGLARGYVWWPGIDEQLEKCVKSCETCQVNRKSPPAAPMHAWSWPNKPWSRVHIDYAGPFMGKMFLVIIDAHSKWMEVHKTASSSSTATIGLLRTTFATLGLPEVIVSDNAANFTSEEFSEFLKRNGVRHVRTPPYHPASNGLAERAVQSFKEGMKKLKDGSIDTKLARFLFKYRMTPQSSTGISPAELMFGRRLRTQFDHLHPDMSKKARDAQLRQAKGHDVRTKSREFNVGDLVYARNYSPGPMWLPGEIVEKQGSTLYTVLLTDGRRVRKHTDQLMTRVRPAETARTESNGPEECDPVEYPTVVSPTETVPSAETGSRDTLPESETLSPDPEPEPNLDLTANGAHNTEPEQEQSAPPEIRRSSRSRQPPTRYGDYRTY